jgi:uncharacterized repeat protein (TIGR03803 family)
LSNDGAFYGTTYGGESFGLGVVYRVGTNGQITTLASFDFSAGACPEYGLALGPDGAFYGSTFF